MPAIVDPLAIVCVTEPVVAAAAAVAGAVVVAAPQRRAPGAAPLEGQGEVAR